MDDFCRGACDSELGAVDFFERRTCEDERNWPTDARSYGSKPWRTIFIIEWDAVSHFLPICCGMEVISIKKEYAQACR